MRYKIKILLVLFCTWLEAYTQNPNLNFGMQNFTNWQLSNGIRGACCPTPGSYGPNSHVIITTPGNDGNVGAALPRIPSGATQVARLGNPPGGGEAEWGRGWRLNYTAQVTADEPILHYQVALVTDQTHTGCIYGCGIDNDLTKPSNGYLAVRITGPDGNPIGTGTCSAFELSPDKTPNWMTNGINTVSYLPWSSIGMDLTPYIGQSIGLEFTVYACYYMGVHGAYAYIYPDFTTPLDTVRFCAGKPAVVAGIPRFKTYLWSNGQTTESGVFENAADGDIVTCTYGSFNGCSMTKSYYLQADSVTAGFKFAEAGCRQFNFADTSFTNRGNMVAWAWDFGDPASNASNISAVQHPSHSFTSPGNYTVRLVATGSSGCTDTSWQMVSVADNPLYLTTDFEYIQAGCRNYQFTDLSTTTQGNINTWLWNFGDPASGANNSSNDQNPVHLFATAGTYNVSLTATSSAGCSRTIQYEVEVQPDTLFVKAGFAMQSTGCRTIQFTDTSSTANTSIHINNWHWRFNDLASGNDSVSILQNPLHVFSEPGSYEIQLTVQTDNGCYATTSSNVTFDVLSAQFNYPAEACQGDSLYFVSTSGGQNITSYQWDFGDGTATVSGNEVKHKYSNGGIFTVTHTVTNSSGCEEVRTAIVGVKPKVTAAFITSPDPAFYPDGMVRFINQSSGSMSVWDFGVSPSAGSAQTNPTFAYNAAGTYTVTLISDDGIHGCPDTIQKIIIIGHAPVVNNLLVCLSEGQQYNFNGTVLTQSGQYFATFITADGRDSIVRLSLVIPVRVVKDTTGFGSILINGITYASSGNARILIKSKEGCDSIYKDYRIEILPLTGLKIPNAFSPNGDGINDTWVIGFIERYSGVVVEIYNRYGQMLQRWSGSYKPWDGRHSGKDVPAATYYYIIDLRDGRKKLTGFVDVLR